MNSKLFILFLSFCLFSSCSTMLEIITGDYKCAYPNCNERATTNSVYCPYHKSPTILNSIITYIPSPVFPPLSFSPYPFQPGLWSPWKERNYGYTWTIPDFRVSGNFWLVIFKIRYLCLPLFYETRTTPSCHPSGCAYRQL